MEPAGVATVLHLYCDSWLPLSCSRDCDVKGAVIAGIPMDSETHGSLMDEHVWTVMEHVMTNVATDCVLLTPPTRSFTTSPSLALPAFRGTDGPAISGAAGLPQDLKNIVKTEDLLWHKVSATLAKLKVQKKAWLVAFPRRCELTPLRFLTEVTSDEEVSHHKIKLNSLHVDVCVRFCLRHP